MLRLIHSQTVQGAILVDDIDDGLPNKTAHRIGSTADPGAYVRDGYANVPKQSTYISRTKHTNPLIPGYIDLEESQRVLLSAGKGKISGLQTAGLISVVSFDEGDIVAPNVTSATLGTPAAGDLTVGGTGFLSTTPEITTVNLWGTGVGGTSIAPAITLTVAQIIAVSPGAVTDTSIVIDSTLLPSLATGDFVRVNADAQSDYLVIS